MTRDSLLEKIASFYLQSRDFNGVPVRTLFGDEKAQCLAALKGLIEDELVAIVFGDGHPNPHIRALKEHHSPAKQVELLDTDLAEHACAYPLRKHLETVVRKADYDGRPYALPLALGEPQLTHRAFDLFVLETYRNDPRYSYSCDDIYGSISINDDGATVPEADQIILEHFGFAYDDALNKYVAVFLWDLFKLSPEHQRLWHVREITQKTWLHPDYYRTQILGDWPERVSIYQAFVEELKIINQMSEAMGRPALFREDFSKVGRPREFASLLRPTAREFNNFVHLLDKMMSENVEKGFFRGEVPNEDEHQRSDGKIEIKPRGTLRMLEDWLSQNFRPRDPKPLQDMLATFREVRKRRQKPAHAVQENSFDQALIHEQRNLMVRAYDGVRTLRLIFANHPSTKDVQIDYWLREGKIWSK